MSASSVKPKIRGSAVNQFLAQYWDVSSEAREKMQDRFTYGALLFRAIRGQVSHEAGLFFMPIWEQLMQNRR